MPKDQNLICYLKEYVCVKLSDVVKLNRSSDQTKVWVNNISYDVYQWFIIRYSMMELNKSLERKIDIFLSISLNICYGCSKNRLIEMVLLEYPQHMVDE